MKLTVFFMLAICLHVSATGFSQRVTISLNRAPLEKVFKSIKNQTGFGFFYDQDLLKLAHPVSISVQDAPLAAALDICFENQPMTYSIVGNTVVLKQKPIETNISAYVLPIAISQTKTIVKGVVRDNNGNPLANVSVMVKGMANGTTTSEEGKYILDVPDSKSAILVFSMVGFIKQEIQIQGRSSIDVVLKVEIKQLDETVVIGYGKTDRKELIGSVGTYKPDNIGGNPLTVGELLAGRIAGVQVSTSSGVPGSANAITIRGISTLGDGGNAPLIVIDGVPSYGLDNSNNTTKGFNLPKSSSYPRTGSITSNGYTTTNSFERSPLATLNPDDIESFSVLKDAYATAIYGSRAAAGVILITTKRGKSGRPMINLQYSTNVQQAFGRPKIMSGSQYVSFYNTLLDTLRHNPPTIYWPSTLSNFQLGENNNWLDQILRNGIGYDANASISGGTDRTKYFISGGYNSQQSYIINNNFSRLQGRLNLEQKITDRFKIGAAIGLSSIKNNALNAQEIYYTAVTKAPNVPTKDSLGNYLWSAVPYTFNGYTTPSYASYGSTQDMNPVGTAKTGINYITDIRTIGNVFGELKITNWLNLRSEFGIDWLTSRAYNRIINKIGTLGGAAVETYGLNKKYVLNNLINFNKNIEKHQVSIMVGQSFEKSIEGNTSLQGTGFVNDQILSIATGTTRNVLTDIQQAWTLFSIFGRFDYTYNNKYMLGVTHRIDGSSRFSYNNRYLQFPSFSTGWIINRENFMKDIKWVNTLKVRGGIGFTGTDGGGGYYGYQGQYSFNGNNTYGNLSPLQSSTPANPNLKWQNTRNFDAGVDAKLFENRINATIDYYNKYTKNLLAAAPLPGFMGFTSQLQNLGEMRNTGFEITIETNNVETKNFRWSTTFNLARNTNVITKLYGSDTLISAVNNQLPNGRIWLPGQSATAFYLYQWGGVNPQNGNPIWINSKNQKTEIPFEVQYISNVDYLLAMNSQRINRGDALPKFFGGLENRLEWKNFDFSCFFTYAYGNKVFNGVKAALYNYASANAPNLSPDMLKYWKNSGDLTNIPALVNQSSIAKLSSGASQVFDYTVQRTSDRFLEDGSFIRLQNLTISYTFPKSVIDRLRIKEGHIKLFAEGNNLFILTKYSGIDPEVSAYGSSALSAGFDEITLPNPRTYRLGFKIGL